VDITPAEADEQLYGTVDIGKSARRDKIKHIEIANIYPDPTQPRRVIPGSARGDWQPNPAEMADFLQHWIEQIGVDLEPFFADSNEIEPPEYAETAQTALLQIVLLAVSIKRNGLANPITVVRNVDTYHIETGERRWVAYHLLNMREPGAWGKIPARIMDEIDVWRQAAENNARQNLNAISKARQYAILLMDLLSEEGETFEPLETFSKQGLSDRHFYTQVADMRVPRGKNAVLMSALGFANRSSASRCRSILALPDEAWQIADDYNIAEEILHNWVMLEPAQAVEAAQGIVAARNNSPQKSDDPIPYAPGTKRHLADLTRAIKRAGVGKDKANERALEKLQEMRHWIDEQEAIIQRYLRVRSTN
jgi:hypothetical protein